MPGISDTLVQHSPEGKKEDSHICQNSFQKDDKSLQNQYLYNYSS